MKTRLWTQRRSSFAAVACLLVPFCTACSDPGSDSVVLTADLPLHLEDHLDAATVEGSEVPADLLEPVVWRFDEAQPDWKPTVGPNPAAPFPPVQVTRTEDALRIILTEANNSPQGNPLGGISIDLPDLKGKEWASIFVRARSTGQMRRLQVTPGGWSNSVEVINDGSVHTYLFPLDRSADTFFTDPAQGEAPWRQLGVMAFAGEPASIDILAVGTVPAEVPYADVPVGVRTVGRGGTFRRTLYMHAPRRLAYRVRVPEQIKVPVQRRPVLVPIVYQVPQQASYKITVPVNVQTRFEATN